MSTLLVCLIAPIVFMVSTAFAETPFQNLDQIAQALSVATFAESKSARTVKIAILDNGFLGRDAEIGKSLPASTIYHAGPIAVDPTSEEAHGLFMAQLVSGLLAKTPGIAYELHLYSAYGYSNLAEAIKSVVADHFDVVLFSQVWEYGGNGDGKGFINTLVNQATRAGLIWINASGNFGDATYLAPVETMRDNWAYLPSPNQGVRVRCFDNSKHKCHLRAVLSWNDFKENPDIGSEKDLDLVLSDDTLKVLRTGGLQQVLATPTNAVPGTSLYPREIVEADVDPGVYELRVKIRSRGFTKANDTLRIVTSGDFLEQLDTTSQRETLLPPADNAGVITVGATDSPKSSASFSMRKPEFSVASEVVLKNGDAFKGSSNSAAMTAVLAVIARSLNPNADRAAVLSFLHGRSLTQSTPALTLDQLGFYPTGRGCFRFANLPTIPNSLLKILQSGAVSVWTTAGIKIFTNDDPFSLGFGLMRTLPDDMLVGGPTGVRTERRTAQRMLLPGKF